MDKLSNDEIIKVFYEYQALYEKELKIMKTKLLATEAALKYVSSFEVIHHDTCNWCGAPTYIGCWEDDGLVFIIFSSFSYNCCNKVICDTCLWKKDEDGNRVAKSIKRECDGTGCDIYCKTCDDKKQKYKK